MTSFICPTGAGVTAGLVPRGFGPPGPNLLADLVPLNYILADLVPPPKCRYYLNIFNISIVIYIVDFISMISVQLINHCV